MSISLPRFEPITELDGYAFVFSQKNSAGLPAIWIDPYANPYSVACVLRVLAEQIEIAADEEVEYDPAQRRRDKRDARALRKTEVQRDGSRLGRVPPA